LSYFDNEKNLCQLIFNNHHYEPGYNLRLHTHYFLLDADQPIQAEQQRSSYPLSDEGEPAALFNSPDEASSCDATAGGSDFVLQDHQAPKKNHFLLDSHLRSCCSFVQK
jgi:hypothetical protein